MKNIVQLFLRQGNQQSIIKEIDGLRFIAIVAVVLSHFNLQMIKMNASLSVDFEYSNPVALFLELGGYGVRIFFCVSAFILSIPFIKHYLYGNEKVSLKKYYARRIKRLEVPYLLVLVILLLFKVFMEGALWKDEMPHFISSIFYSHNIIYDRRSTINPVAWTLEIEIQFYILLPFILKLFFSIKNFVHRRVVLITAISMSVLACVLFYHAIKAAHLEYSIVTYLPVFLLGILFADIYLNCNTLLQSKKFIWDFVGIAGYLMIIYFAGYAVFYKQLIELTGYLFLFTGVFKGVVLNTVFTKKIIMAIGCMCYSIYLLHYALLAFITQKITVSFFQNNYYKDLLLQGVVVLPLVLIICSIFYLVVEKPFVKMK